MLAIVVAGTSANDPFLTYNVAATTSWSTGIDNSVSGDPYVISASNALGTSNVMSITTSGVISITSLIFGSGSTLSTYQEGTWVPTLTFGGASTGITYSTQSARYIRIGKNVQVWVTIELSNKGSSNGAAAVTGLPYTVQNSITQFSPIFCSVVSLTATYTMFGVQPTNNATTFGLVQASNVVGAVAAIADTAFANNSAIYATFTYEALT